MAENQNQEQKPGKAAEKFHAADKVLVKGLESGKLKTGKEYTVTGKMATVLIEKGAATFVKIVKKFDKETYNEKMQPKD